MRNFANLYSPVGEKLKYGFFSSYFVMVCYLLYSVGSIIGPLSNIQFPIFEQFLFLKAIVIYLYFFTWSMLFADQFYKVHLLVSSLAITFLAVISFSFRKPTKKKVSLLFSNCVVGIPVGILFFVFSASVIPLGALVMVLLVEMLLGRIRG